MITAEKLALLTGMPTEMLTKGIQETGYKKDKFYTSKFLGMTNGNQFCYSATYKNEHNNNELSSCKVFVTYDPARDRVIVDY